MAETRPGGDPIPLKPFDAVVQRRTNHALINTGNPPRC